MPKNNFFVHSYGIVIWDQNMPHACHVSKPYMHASRFSSYVATIRKYHLRNQFWTSQLSDKHSCFILLWSMVWFSNQKADIHSLLSPFVPSEVPPINVGNVSRNNPYRLLSTSTWCIIHSHCQLHKTQH